MIERNTSPLAIVFLIVFGVLVLGIWSLGASEALNPLRAATDAQIRLTDHALSAAQTAAPATVSSYTTRVAALQTVIPLEAAATAQALSFSATAVAIQDQRNRLAQIEPRQGTGKDFSWVFLGGIVGATFSVALTIALILTLLRARERESRLQREKQALQAIAHSNAVWAQREARWMALRARANASEKMPADESGESACAVVSPRRNGHMTHVDVASLNRKGGCHE